MHDCPKCKGFVMQSCGEAWCLNCGWRLNERIPDVPIIFDDPEPPRKGRRRSKMTREERKKKNREYMREYMRNYARSHRKKMAQYARNGRARKSGVAIDE